MAIFLGTLTQLAWPGCGAKLGTTGRELEAKLETSEQARHQERSELDRRLADLEAAIGELRAVQATSQVRQQTMAEELAALREQAGHPSHSGPRSSPKESGSEGRLIDEAAALIETGQPDRARQILLGALEGPLSPAQAARAQLLLGESHYREQSFHEAILAFQRVVEDYPLAPEVPQALLREAMCFALVGSDENASFLFRKLMAEHPDSKEAKQVRLELGVEEQGPAEGPPAPQGEDAAEKPPSTPQAESEATPEEPQAAADDDDGASTQDSPQKPTTEEAGPNGRMDTDALPGPEELGSALDEDPAVEPENSPEEPVGTDLEEAPPESAP